MNFSFKYEVEGGGTTVLYLAKKQVHILFHRCYRIRIQEAS
jgi:2-phospho-L-lactate guanylyltransferase (CobY/MobA/RfbA family)